MEGSLKYFYLNRYHTNLLSRSDQFRFIKQESLFVLEELSISLRNFGLYDLWLVIASASKGRAQYTYLNAVHPIS